MIRSIVNSNDGWGKKPVRQDTAWDMEESPKLPRKPLTSSGSSSGSQENNSSTWTQSNDGTAIWESAKADQPPQPSSNSWGNASGGSAPIRPPQQVGPATRTHWGNPDADGGTWEGPPDAKPPPPSNMWNGPPNQQMSGSSGSWGEGRSNSWDGPEKPGNIFLPVPSLSMF